MNHITSNWELKCGLTSLKLYDLDIQKHDAGGGELWKSVLLPFDLLILPGANKSLVPSCLDLPLARVCVF